MAHLLLILAVASPVAWAQSIGDTNLRLGTYIGKFKGMHYNVGGKVYAASETQVRLFNFNYNGGGPGEWCVPTGSKVNVCDT